MPALLFAVLTVFLRSEALGSGFFPQSPFSDKAAGTTSAAFLKVPAGARAEALAGSYVAAVDNSESVFWNPAGLAALEGTKVTDVSLGYNMLLQGSYNSSVAVGHPIGPGALGLGVNYFSAGNVQGYNNVGDPTSSFTPNDVAVSGAYALRTPYCFAGGGLKLIHSSVAEASGTTFAVDAGVQAEHITDVGEGALDVGLSVMNLGPALRIGSLDSPLPFQSQLGTLWHINKYVNGMLDGHLPVDQDPYVSIGAEGWLPVNPITAVAARAGYSSRRSQGLDALSFGVGLYYDRFRLDYAFVPFSGLDVTNRVSIGYAFGPVPAESDRKAVADQKKHWGGPFW